MWTDDDKVQFTKAVRLFGHDAKNITGFVETKTIRQVRRRIQEMKRKLEKNPNM